MVVVAVTVAGTFAAGAGQAIGTNTGIGLAELWRTLMLPVTAVFIVRRVLARPVVTIQSIYGAVSAHLIIGLMFAALYSTIDHLTGHPSSSTVSWRTRRRSSTSASPR